MKLELLWTATLGIFSERAQLIEGFISHGGKDSDWKLAFGRISQHRTLPNIR